MRTLLALLSLTAFSAQAQDFFPSECLEQTPQFADTVIQANGSSGKGYGDPSRAANGVRGGGANAGGLDVYSLNSSSDGTIILSFSDRSVCNGPGADLAVFENGFRQLPSNALFFEPVVVSVSLDGSQFESFPHEYLGSAALSDVVNDVHWIGFAGMTPVLYNELTHNFAEHGIDPLDSTVAGGDAFDLDNLPDTDVGLEIKAKGFRYVKLQGAPRLGFPDSPNSFGGLADIDGVYAKRFAPLH